MQRGFHCSERVVLFHLFPGCLFCGGWFVSSEDIRLFAFHLFSYKLTIVDRLQNFDDRQSLERARHGLKKNSLSKSCMVPYL